MRLKKSTLAGVFLIFITLGSTFAIGAYQSLSPSQASDGVELPERDIIDYSLTSEQQRYLTLHGFTVVEIEYSLACQNCTSTKTRLEAAVGQFQGQMILSELIVADSASLPLVRMDSSYGSMVFNNPTPDQLASAFCDLLYSPPASCALNAG